MFAMIPTFALIPTTPTSRVSRATRIRNLVFTCSLLLPALSLGQGDFDKVEVTATHVAGSVYVLTGMGGNIGVSAGPDGILLVDDQFAPLADKIRAALAGIGKGSDVVFVLNTHWHGDHTGGNHVFAPAATVIAHENVRRRLAGDPTIGGRIKEEPVPKGALPVITFEGSLKIHFNGEVIEVMHYPKGHTDGDSVIYFHGSNVVHMGDHLFADMFPFVDLRSGGDVAGYVANQKLILERMPAGAKVIPGHGEIGDAKAIERSVEMIGATSAVIRDAIAKGKELDDIKGMKLPEAYADWSWGFIPTEKWIETLYESYSR